MIANFLLLWVAFVQAFRFNDAITSFAAPSEKGDLGAKCFRAYECLSDCCLPDTYPNGTVKEWDPQGFPIRICMDHETKCSSMKKERILTYVIICVSLLFIGFLIFGFRRYQQKNREIRRLKYRLQKAKDKMDRALAGEPVSPQSSLIQKSKTHGFGTQEWMVKSNIFHF